MVKKGDTLIEVTIAVGIFAMVAISIVAVMSGGTSSTQTALETTLAREEIDAQAEALRFIQAAYIADKDTSDQSATGDRYTKLWRAITSRAVVLSSADSTEILKYTPSSCSALYDTAVENGKSKGEVFGQKAFILNYRNLGSTFNPSAADSWVNSVLIPSTTTAAAPQATRFAAASTYPHLIYGASSTQTEDDVALIADTSGYRFYRAEGIYIIAVRDDNTTSLIGDSEKTAAFYDFYIRTCWYGTDANQPSTISTVIRLYDPDAVKEVAKKKEEETYYLQNLPSNVCATKARDSDISIRDRRDNQSYTVRYISGRCWMTQNLRITGTVSAKDSNFSTEDSVNVCAGDLTSGNSYDQARCHNSGNSNNGVWYNMAAASAMTITGSTRAPVTEDICPAGWRLPTHDTSSPPGSINSLIGHVTEFSPVTGGEYQNGQLVADYLGYYWSSKNIYGNHYMLRYDGSTLETTSAGRHDYGIYIRCVQDA